MHGTFSLQLACSFCGPRAGLPQGDATCATSRERSATPPAQLWEQEDHSVQSPHSPSLQLPWQCPSRQASTSAVGCGWQGSPSCEGCWAMCRFLVLEPKPQLALQLPQALQSAQAQSTFSSHALECDTSPQLEASLRAPLKPAPSWELVTCRSRTLCPMPQEEVQLDQLVHAPTCASSALQVLTMQLLASTKEIGHGWPWYIGFCVTCLCLCDCPTPQSLSQASQAVQAETLQSMGS
mmetsp:Transcript_70544/g.168444  ORF Transcript_70544/g.168444 Transcript_70544/m.168444 type:complete len:237 (-) Transcript_70544:499-1209(-)